MLRSQEPRNSFTPVNRPDKGEWVFTDIEELARYTGSEPVLVDQIYGSYLSSSFVRSFLSVIRCAQHMTRPTRRQPWESRAVLARRRARWSERLD